MQLRAAATLAVASTLLIAGPAVAAPATPTVRVEGDARTLFEGPVTTDGHAIRATSDTVDRRCDGTNNGKHPTPGPTATAATVDALSIVGLGFDGQWYPGYDDYFVKQLGPDRESASRAAYWGLLVDKVYTPVGGCQFQVASGQEVLWAADAFTSRPFLFLTVDGRPGPTATVAPGDGLTVQVTRVDSSGELDPVDPTPADGATVAPVDTGADGFQTVLTSSSDAVRTDADGRVTLRWTTPGWHRVKATLPDGALDPADGFEDGVRSNRLDVCVPAAGADGCGAAPADTLVRAPALPPATVPAPDASATPAPDTPASPGGAPAPGAPAAVVPGPVRLLGPSLVSGGAARGRTRVSWTVADPGPGIREWRLQSRTAPARGWVTRATGATATRADLALPAGRESRLRFVLTDTLGRTATSAVGRVLIPIDDRALALRGRWRARPLASAWRGGVSLGRRDATATVRLAAGRPTVSLAPGGSGTIEVRAGKRRQRFAVGKRAMRVVAAARKRSGTVQIRVLRGKVRLDGVASAP